MENPRPESYVICQFYLLAHRRHD